MRKLIVALLLGTGIGLWVTRVDDSQSQVYGQHPYSPRETKRSGSLIALQTRANDGGEHVVLIDADNKRMNVYHINNNSGAVSLRSVRNVRWDLLIEDFNGTEPLPQEIRALIGGKQ